MLDGPESNPGEGEIFRTCPERPWGPPSLLYNGYRVFPWGKKRPEGDADPSPPSSAVVMKGRVIPLLPLWAVRPVQSLSACTRVTFTLLPVHSSKRYTVSYSTHSPLTRSHLVTYDWFFPRNYLHVLTMDLMEYANAYDCPYRQLNLITSHYEWRT